MSDKDHRIQQIVDANNMEHGEMSAAFAQGAALSFNWCGNYQSVLEFVEFLNIGPANIYYNDSKGWAEVLVTRRPQ